MSEYNYPLGGISALYVGVASSNEAALAEGPIDKKIELLEDCSHYTECVSWIGYVPKVEHKLTMITAPDVTLDEILDEGLRSGFVAWIEFNSGLSIRVGWSDITLGDRALKLESVTTTLGDSRSAKPQKVWVFSSIDDQITL